MQTIEVNGASPYEVTIGHNLFKDVAKSMSQLGANQAAIITQPVMGETAKKLVGAIEALGKEATIITVPDAEDGKNLNVAGDCWDVLGRKAFGRKDVIISLGGGAVTDLAGFVAACWMRGIAVIHVPTTLLSMVDAAVGGKTGINTSAGKNLVGAFHEPSGVFIDLDMIATLPDREKISGSAEIIKTGFIADTKILSLYEEDPEVCFNVEGYLPELIARSVAVKARVVASDLREAGQREILNYGHTFGHAVELKEKYEWRHGNAVSVGMMFVAALARNRGLITDELYLRHKNILSSVGLPTTYPEGHFAELYQAMLRDKKNRDGRIRFVALIGAGKTIRIEDVDRAELIAAYETLNKGGV
ncbi:3-dehydroquinate synthase [Corynebacterium pseudotuberculosis]|uniref:3-dehydroquinate synthase n=1 Tax=Corynebacterium pseudotuberculosis TaxID=1719 RepID=UPI0009914ACE|nr:3-dehydroquinate synthase [Corynebacterium pseudotuberculosis]AQU92867.1 3-dehydroquinate synthase [Corynebacterium pseudotuberculosis]